MSDQFPKPDDEEQQVLDAELVNARRELHALLVAEAYEKVETRDLSGPSNLLGWTQRKTNVRERIPGGSRLQQDIARAKLRVDLLNGLYDDYQQRYDAWADNMGLTPAETPEEPAEENNG